MKKIASVLLIFTLLFSCTQNSNNDKGINYTDYINAQALEKTVVEKYPSGKEKAIIFTLRDIANSGIVKEIHFFENGNIQVEGTLKNNKRHGIWTFYHKNGQIWSTGEFNMGKSTGEFDIFDDKGEIKFKYYYQEGERIKQEIFQKGELYKTVDLSKTKNGKTK